jgi:hypothetical protein
MKEISYLFAQGVTPRQIRRGTVPKKLMRDKNTKKAIIAYNIIIMMAVVSQPTVALDFSRVWLQRVSQNYLMYNGIKNNESGFFTVAPTDPTLVLWKAAIESFKNSQDNVDANVPDAVETRGIRWKALMKMNRKIRSYVQGIVDDNLESAELIVADAHMVLVIHQGRGKNVFSASSNKTGSIELQGAVKSKRQCTEWEICLDPTDPANWNVMRVPPTLAAETEITGLESGKDYYVRSRVITNMGPDEWSPVIKVRVK